MAATNELVALGQDGVFRQRCRKLIRQFCGQVQAEAGTVTNHAQRYALAQKFATGSASPEPLIDYLVTRTNLTASVVSAVINADSVVQVTTDASDAAILSQLDTDFGFLGGA